jgi:hypothetical protein
MPNEVMTWLGIAVVAVASVVFAEHPTAKQVRRAILDTLEFGSCSRCAIHEFARGHCCLAPASEADRVLTSTGSRPWRTRAR